MANHRRLIEFQSDLHEDRFNAFLDATQERSEYFADDKFYQGMVYVLTSDFLNWKFEKIIDDSEQLVINYQDVDSIFLSSTEKFVMRFALSMYFPIAFNYKFTDSYYQLSNENQMLIDNALKFLKH